MRYAASFLLLLGACGSTGGSGAAIQVPFFAGAASVDLAPGRNVPLGGYSARHGRPMTGIHDPVTLKALWLETPGQRICIVTGDLIGTDREIRDACRPEGVPLVFVASHTHSGPGALAKSIWRFAMGKYDPMLHASVQEKVTKVIALAREARRPARLAFARTRAPELVRNRRADDGPVDPEVNVLVVVDQVSRPIATLTNFAAHGTFLGDENFLMSADWPGAFQRAVEEDLGGIALYTNGAEGDLAPRSPGGRTPFERSEAMGRALARKVVDLASAIDNTTNEVKLKYVERGVELTPTLLLAPRKTVLGVLEINGVRMFCFPGEPCASLGLALKRRFPGSWILGLANDHLGYFLSEEEYAKGGYERRVSFYGPKFGPWLVERFSALGEGEGNDATDRAGQPEGGRGQDHHGR